MTGADIEEICEAAGRTAVYEFALVSEENPEAGATAPGEKRTTVAITFRDLWDQIRVKKFGHPKPVNLHPQARKETPRARSGTRCGDRSLPARDRVCGGATLRPTENFLAAVLREKDSDDLINPDEEDMLRTILISLNSRAVEKVIFGGRYSGFSEDLKTPCRRHCRWWRRRDG